MPRGRKAGHTSISAVCQGADYSEEERVFLVAMDQYKRQNQRPFPSWREVLAVIHALGWRRVAEPTTLPTAAQVREQEGL